MTETSVLLINTLSVAPANQSALIALLKTNIDTVISTLPGWISTRLIVAGEASIIILSEWQSAEAVGQMREDPRMKAYFPKLLALASFASVTGAEVHRRDARAGQGG